MPAPSYKSRKKYYEKKWANMRVKSTGWQRGIDRVARKILKNKERYIEISQATNGIPWYFIAILHNRESSLNFNRHLHNGDSLKRRTRRVPAGRPKSTPPFTFEESCIDAMKMKGFHRVTDWSIPHIAFMSERYNGWGYYFKRRPSPYLWSGSNQYVSGKYVADGKYSSRAVDQQLGVMPLLKRILELDADQPNPIVVTHKQEPTKPDVKDLPKVSRKVSLLTRIKTFVAGLWATGATYITADSLKMIPDNWERIEELMRNNMFVVMFGVSVLTYLVAQYLHSRTEEDYVEGRYEPSNMDK